MEAPTYSSIIKSLAYFQLESKAIYSYLKKEEDISLDFSGYVETIAKSKDLKNITFDENYKYMMEINAWVAYLNELLCVLKKIASTYENRSLYLMAFVNPKKNNQKLQYMIEDNDEKKMSINKYISVIFNQIKMLNVILKYTTYEFNEGISKYNR